MEQALDQFPQKSVALNPLHILLIEDEETDYFIVNRELQKADAHAFDVHWCATFKKALTWLSDHPIDIVLLDLTLVDSRDFDGLLTLREKYPSLPIIVLTDLDHHHTALKALKFGAQDYLIKSEVPTLLARSIHYAMERQQIIEQKKSSRKDSDCSI